MLSVLFMRQQQQLESSSIFSKPHSKGTYLKTNCEWYMISKDLCKPTPQTKGIRISQAGEGQEPQNSPSDIVF